MIINRILSLTTHRLREIPVLVLMPHSRCNCRCIMCDIWKANQEKKELSIELIKTHIDTFVRFGVREVVLSGGEALMHSNFWNLCSEFKKRQIKVVLLSTGLLLERNADRLIENLDEIIVSLDGSQPVHDKIRNVPNAYAQLADGVKAIKSRKPLFKITARCVIQRYNFSDFFNIVAAAHSLGLDGVSFLAADVHTSAFNRVEPWDDQKRADVTLSPDEVETFEAIVRESFQLLRDDYSAHFIAESPEKMIRIVRYYQAICGLNDFPRNACNAPWVSAVIESNGDIMPCFFHRPYGNLSDGEFETTINSDSAIRFRKELNISTNPVCKKCVCTLKLGLTQ